MTEEIVSPANLPPCGLAERLKAALLALLMAVAIAVIMAPLPSSAASRIKDIANFEGVRDNMLVGYGLVVGLDGTGDSLRNAPFTMQSLQGMLERLGVNIRAAGANMKTANVAAVMVTATLHGFARSGAKVDVAVSALGDAKSLRGGTLLVTPLMGADGEIYAVGQGSVAVGGFKAEGQGQSVTKGVLTNGRIASGAIVEREIKFDLASMPSVRISLKNPDMTTAQRMAGVINAKLRSNAAAVLDPATVQLSLPDGYQGDIVALMSDVEQLKVQPDEAARIVINEQLGIVVIGSEVKVSKCAIAQGNLTIKITETPQVSQPAPFSQGGTTTTVPRTNIEVSEDQGKKLAVMNEGVTLQDLVNGLNALGVTPQDLISILQALKAAGAVQAEIEVM